MENAFEYIQGSTPLLISMPHNSAEIPAYAKTAFTEEALKSTDTDWFVDRLYDFTESMGVHILKPAWSRYYIDLNRDLQGTDLYPGMNSTELCPTTDFKLKPLYKENKVPSVKEIEHRIESAWKSYHQAIKDILARIKSRHGYAILFDAHSIKSRVPRFFDGQLPDFNFGTNDGLSCDKSILSGLEALDFGSYTQVSNGRFKGGFITRNYGEPENNIHAIQLELSQATYLDEVELKLNHKKLSEVQPYLETIITYLLNWK